MIEGVAWRTLDNYPNMAINREGEIRKIIPSMDGPNSGVYWKLIRQYTTPNGYRQVKYLTDGRQKSESVHRLVAMAFCERLCLSHDQVNHIDGCKANNNASNLEWCNALINMRHAVDTGLFEPQRKLTDEEVIAIRANQENLSQRKLGEIYGVDHSTISRIKNRRTYTHI